MGKQIKVGMADLNICSSPDTITTLGLGSCVGIVLYDASIKVCGLAHIMLPDSTQIRNNENVAKFADTAIDVLIEKLVQAGANKSRFTAKIAGERNVDATKTKLKSLGIRILAEDVGLNYGRTIEFFPETGQLMIKAVGKEIKYI